MDQCIQFEADRGTSVLGQEARTGIQLDVRAAHAAAQAAQANWVRRAHADRLALLGEMSASIVHEITQPLAAIATNAQTGRLWLERAAPDIDKALGSITRIIDAADRAAKLIKLVRAMASKTEPEMSSVDLNEVVGEALALVRSEALDRRIALRPVLAAGLPPIRGNRTQLQQVIINLVLNGLQATEGTGDRTAAVVIRTSRYGAGHLLLAVEDRGVGVDAEKLDRLFRPFYSTKSQGMGMGLSICRAIADIHGGELRAVRNAGSGMTFEFTIPAALEVM
jgi:signal transduction histidine kinase